MRRQQSDFAQNWWSQVWMSSIEVEDPGRMQRGKSYARQGRVTELEIDTKAGRVKARVKGSRLQAYRVELSFAPLPAQTRLLLIHWLSQQPELLRQTLPQDWERQLQGQGLTLLPDPLHEMSFSCSCPDWSVPCKHSSALVCILASQMDAEPALLLELRGVATEKYLPQQAAVPQGPPLDLEAHRFWGLPLQVPELLMPPQSAPVLQELGAMPGSLIPRRRLKEALEPVYTAASQTGAEVLSALLQARSEASSSAPPDEQN